MSQHYRRIPLGEFLRQAVSILDDVTNHGETVLIEHNGRFYTLGTYQAYRKRPPARPQPPNRQDSLWSFARSAGAEPNANGSEPARIADEAGRLAPRPDVSRRERAPGGKPSK